MKMKEVSVFPRHVIKPRFINLFSYQPVFFIDSSIMLSAIFKICSIKFNQLQFLPFKSSSFLLWWLVRVLNSHSSGITTSNMIWFMDYFTKLISVFPIDFIISDNNPDDPTVFPFFVYVIDCLTISLSTKQWALFSELFSYIFITSYQHSIIIFYRLFIKSVLNKFYNPICSLQHDISDCLSDQGRLIRRNDFS